MSSSFTRATRTQAKLRLCIAGPSGSGKTYTSLQLGCGLKEDRRMALIDTEHSSASTYADLCDFDVAPLDAPYSPERYLALMGEAAKAGYGLLIIDSLSHAWAGEGGVLDIVDTETARTRSNNSYIAWRKGTPAQNSLVEGILSWPGDVIVTLRTKQDYVLEDDGRGHKTPKKVGMAPVQREGLDYEFGVVLELDREHTGVVTKSRFAPLADLVVRKPGSEFAAEIKLCLAEGVTVERPTPPADVAAASTPAAGVRDEGDGDGSLLSSSPEPLSDQRPVREPASSITSGPLPTDPVSGMFVGQFQAGRIKEHWTEGQVRALIYSITKGRTDIVGELQRQEQPTVTIATGQLRSGTHRFLRLSDETGDEWEIVAVEVPTDPESSEEDAPTGYGQPPLRLVPGDEA